MAFDPAVFRLVKERVDIAEAAEHYGLNPDHRGWCSCPFHGENTPSFHLYNQRGTCFGCGWSGDVIALVGGLLDIDPVEAVKTLNRDFALGLDLDGPVDPQAVREAQRAREEKRRFQAWRECAVGVLTDRFRFLHFAKLTGAGYAVPSGFAEGYAAALKEIDLVEYYLDFVAFGEEGDVKRAVANVEEVLKRCREGERP